MRKTSALHAGLLYRNQSLPSSLRVPLPPVHTCRPDVARIPAVPARGGSPPQDAAGDAKKISSTLRSLWRATDGVWYSMMNDLKFGLRTKGQKGPVILFGLEGMPSNTK